MRNFFKFLGVIALIAVIGFSMVACDNGSGDNGGNTGGTGGDGTNPSGGTEVVGGDNGDKLEITGAQVYYSIEDQNGTFSYKPYTRDFTLTYNGVTATVTGGKLSFTIDETQITNNLATWTSIQNSLYYTGDYDTVTPSNPTAKYFILASFSGSVENNYYSLKKENQAFSGNTRSFESVMYVYVDNAVTINGTGKTEEITYDDGVTNTMKSEDFSLALKKGWNVVCTKEVFNKTSGTNTTTMSVSNPSHLRWVLEGSGVDQD